MFIRINLINMIGISEIWKKIHLSDINKSYMKKHLTYGALETFWNLNTNSGGTIWQCIKPGVEYPYAWQGCVASDPEAYDLYSDFFTPVIKDYHRLKSYVIYHPPSDYGDLNDLGFHDLDPTGKYIISSRVRVGRSHKGYGFPPVITKQDRKIMEDMSVRALSCLDGDLEGTYMRLGDLSEQAQTTLVQNHYLFNRNDRVLELADVYKDWPENRGIYMNKANTFLAWVNEEDHLRFISMENGANMAQVYTRLITALLQLEKSLSFAFHKNLGYLVFCPSNLGTTLRASVHIRLPHLSSRDDFKDICRKLKLQIRGTDGAYSDVKGGVLDLSNERRLGLTEIQAMKEMTDGVQKLIEMEKELEQK